MYIESIEKVLTGSNLIMVDQKTSNNIMYLPLDRMLNRYESRDVVTDATMPSDSILEVRKKIDELRQRDSRTSRTDRR
jgi:modulator of FtsH protease HflK